MSYFDDIPLWARIAAGIVERQAIVNASTPEQARALGMRIGDDVAIPQKSEVTNRKGWPKGKPRKPKVATG